MAVLPKEITLAVSVRQLQTRLEDVGFVTVGTATPGKLKQALKFFTSDIATVHVPMALVQAPSLLMNEEPKPAAAARTLMFQKNMICFLLCKICHNLYLAVLE